MPSFKAMKALPARKFIQWHHRHLNTYDIHSEILPSIGDEKGTKAVTKIGRWPVLRKLLKGLDYSL